MKINVFKAHPSYPVGRHEVGEARGKYLIQTGFAEVESEEPKAPKKTAAKKETKAAPKKAATKMR